MSRNPEDLLKSVEHHHELYLKSLRQLHDAGVAGLGVRVGRPLAGGDGPGTPSMKATTFPIDVASRPSYAGLPSPESSSGGGVQSTAARRSRRLTNERLAPEKRNRPASVIEAVTDSDDESVDFLPLLSPSQVHSPKLSDDQPCCVTKTVESESFTTHDLVLHISKLDEEANATTQVLDHVWTNRHEEIDTSNTIAALEISDGPHRYASATYEVYDVGRDGKAIARHVWTGDEDDVGMGATTVWESIRDVNSSGDVCGRMTILQEPAPVMLAGIHLSMQSHFDVDELFQHLLFDSTKGKSKAFVQRAFESKPLRQRSFFFVFKYYTVVGDDLTPAPWQRYDHRPADKRSADHIDITECSSVLALSLGGNKVKDVQVKRRRMPLQKGSLYDTFAPWHLLHIQCFPDDEHSMRSDDLIKPFHDGPYAFLDSLAAEYRDAVKRYTQLNEMITKLITPPNQFMFDVKLRDKLLFEDKDFTFSRRYFWSYNTLGVINDSIKSMRQAYSDTFSPDFWAGRHQTLWPHPEPDSLGGLAYAARREGLRHELERAVRELQAVRDKNEHTRTEIRSLREQLFSGSSVMESRRAIEQGSNIKVLTGVSMIFLPLTFVTSVFGITQFDISADNWRFPVTMVSVCVPFFLLILVLQTRAGMDLAKKLGGMIDSSVRSVFGGEDRRHYQFGPMQSAHGAGEGGGHGSDGWRKKRMIPRREGRRGGLTRSQSGFMDGPARKSLGNDNNDARSGTTAKKTTWRWRPWKRRQPPREKSSTESV